MLTMATTMSCDRNYNPIATDGRTHAQTANTAENDPDFGGK